MMDPADRLLQGYVQGTERIQPGGNGSGEWGLDPAGITNVAPGGPTRMARPWDVVLSAGSIQLLDAGDRPDYWLVTQSDTSGAETALWLGTGEAGYRIRIGPRGSHVLPGISQYLYLLATGSGTSTLTVLAVRGYPEAILEWGATGATLNVTPGQQPSALSLSVVEAPATTVYGTKSLTTTDGLALSAGRACRAVSVENPTSNLVMVLIGDSGSQIMELWPGEERTIVCSNVSQVFAKNSSSTTQSVNWAAEVWS